MYIFASRQGTKMEQDVEHTTECVLCIYASYFHVLSCLFDTTQPATNKFFEPVGIEFFRLFSKPFLRSM